MGMRYEYEAPGFFQCLFLALTDRMLGKKTPIAWIREKQSGARFSLDDQEQEILTNLADHLSHFDGLQHGARVKLTDQTFDSVVDAFSARRQGDTEYFDSILKWSVADWENWCQFELQKIDGK